MASTTKTLRKRSRETNVHDEQVVDDAPSKRQRVEKRTNQEITFDDIPVEILSKISSLLPTNSARRFRVVSKRCRTAVANAQNCIQLDMRTLSCANMIQPRVLGMICGDIITRQTTICLKTTAVRPTMDNRHATREMASLVASALMTLNNNCAAVALGVNIGGSDSGSHFFDLLCEFIYPKWKPSYMLGLSVYDETAMPGCGTFVERFGCASIRMDTYVFCSKTNFEQFSNCRMVHLHNCAGLHPTRLSVILQSCETVILEHCNISHAEMLLLGGCKNIRLQGDYVTDTALESFIKCERLTLNRCRGYSSRALGALVERGVVVDVDGAYWPPPPTPPTPEVAYFAWFQALQR